jgi:hypothetical protein
MVIFTTICVVVIWNTLRDRKLGYEAGDEVVNSVKLLLRRLRPIYLDKVKPEGRVS